MIVVGIVAWLLLGERPSRATLLALPIVLVGVVLISGSSVAGRTAQNPSLGVILGHGHRLCYSAYLLIIRRGGRDPAPAGGPVAIATARRSCWRLVVGPLLGDLDLVPPLQSLFWLALLGVTSQSVGYLLISISLPRLPAVVTSIILLAQPVMSMGLAIVLLRETPSVDPAARGSAWWSAVASPRRPCARAGARLRRRGSPAGQPP